MYTNQQKTLDKKANPPQKPPIMKKEKPTISKTPVKKNPRENQDSSRKLMSPRNDRNVNLNQIKVTMSDQDIAIKQQIDDIWDQYDTDRSGALDKNETKKLVKDAFFSQGVGKKFSQEAFDVIFAKFDTDKSGTVEKYEMVAFYKQMMKQK